jgi:hypothetical protein
MYGKSACPVLRGAGVQLEYGRDIVAPSRKQTANGEHKHRPVAPGDSCLLEGNLAMVACLGGTREAGRPPRVGPSQPLGSVTTESESKREDKREQRGEGCSPESDT